MKIDKRKKYILVLDVETAGDVEKIHYVMMWALW